MCRRRRSCTAGPAAPDWLRSSALFGIACGSVPTGFAKFVGVEQVEDFGAELDVARARDSVKCLESTRSTCLKFGPWIELRSRLPNVPGCGVANAAGFRKSSPPSVMNGSTPGTRSGRRTLRVAPPPGVLMIAMRSAAGCAKMLPGRVTIDDVRPHDLHRHRQAAARVDDAADLPAAEQRAAQPDAFVGDRRRAAQVERVTDVEVVVAVVVVELAQSRALLAAVSASFDPPVLPGCGRACTARSVVSAVRRAACSATAAARCSCRGRRSSCSRPRRTGSARR